MTTRKLATIPVRTRIDFDTQYHAVVPLFIFRPTMIFPHFAKYLNTITPAQATQTEAY